MYKGLKYSGSMLLYYDFLIENKVDRRKMLMHSAQNKVHLILLILI